MLGRSSFHPSALLYRSLFDAGVDSHVAYLFARSREDAVRILYTVVPPLFAAAPEQVVIVRTESYHELVERGVSVEINQRVFEFSRHGQDVIQWVENPFFLTPEPALLANWHELQERLARAQTRGLLRRY